MLRRVSYDGSFPMQRREAALQGEEAHRELDRVPYAYLLDGLSVGFMVNAVLVDPSQAWSVGFD